jgi:hypothetical protein
MRSVRHFLALAFLIGAQAASDAAQWQQPATSTDVETIVCNRNDDDEEDAGAHGLVCLKLHCIGGNQFRFTIIADAEFFGATTYSAGPHSITLEMSIEQSSLDDWDISSATVPAEFLTRIESEKEIEVLTHGDGRKAVSLSLNQFPSEFRRVAAVCKIAKVSVR